MRNRYFDMLRALAIIRVVLYHATGWAALTVIFPAMGVMFALSGSFMAASLDRYGVRAVLRRARRLLPPLWAIAAVFVPAMLLTGLVPTWRLVWWLVPLADPPATAWGGSVLGIVWYLREYLWFVLISPIALPAFRRWPAACLAVPFGLLTAITAGLPTIPVVRDFAIYFGCWLLGFAHHDGVFQRIPRPRLIAAALTLALAGAGWLLTHPGPRGYDLNDIALADTLWSTGFVLLLLGLAPHGVPRLDRWRVWSRIVTLLNTRAVTVYLWHPTVVVGVGVSAGLAGLNLAGALGTVGRLTLVACGIAIITVGFGWVEDLAARRRPAMLSAQPAYLRRSGSSA